MAFSPPGQAVEALLESIVEYCDLTENFDRHSLEDFLLRQRAVLPLLYYRMLVVPEIELGDFEQFTRSITHEEWSERFSRLSQYLGRHNLYRLIFDPTILTDDEPVNGALADDFADIWRDLKNGLMHWKDSTESQQTGIIYDWQWTFRTHWSTHLLEALRTINWLIEDHGFCAPTDADDELPE